MKNKNLPEFIMCTIFLFTGAALKAQKLPNVQKTSVYAPANIKIDGKPIEWDNKFEAQNDATSLFYTMANDDNNLYLTLQAIDAPTINKLIRGGLKITIKSVKKTNNSVILAFMVVPPSRRIYFLKSMFEDNAETHKRISDFNDQLNNSIKDIGISGVKDIEDTVISVYNDYGIKQAVLLSPKGVLTCEIAVPIKYIAHLVDANSLKYNLMLPGINNNTTDGIASSLPGTSSHGNVITTRVVTKVVINGEDVTKDIQGLSSPTDFSGTYVLAKRP
jgi:hypothetical protein